MSNLDALDRQDGVAVIGLACRFPGAKDIHGFWQNLCNGVESITFFSDQELLSAGVDPAVLYAPDYVKAAGVLEDIDCFDAAFFGFTNQEAAIMDPQHRFFLECAWEALEDAGYAHGTYRKRIGLYAGASMNSYLLSTVYADRDLLESVDAFQRVIGNEKDHLSTRTSYKLNLKGPSITVGTACSTSLVAIHLACQSLLNGESDMFLAGAVSIPIPQTVGYFYKEGGIASPDGHCRAFDVHAQGTVSGSGVGVAVLKRLEDALAAGDSIYAVIKGSAINNDGLVKIGYTAPSIDGQADVIAEAQAVAEVEPETITYIEAHGTGTPLGDPIEIAALIQAFGTRTEKQQFCAIGSVKTNIGHLDVAAGMAGFIKTALALKYRMLPPSLHFTQPNPKIDFARSPFYVNTALTEWKAGDTPRRAGVSSFGIGGTNAHIILEEAPPVEASSASRPHQLLLFSARSEAALNTTVSTFVEYCKQHLDSDLADIAYTLQVGRREFGYRRALVCHDLDTALNALEMPDSQQVFTALPHKANCSVVFLFPGQGSQYVQMAQELYQREALFREQVDLCSEFLKPLLEFDLRAVLYPDEEQSEAAEQRLNQTFVTQPALFVIEYALAKLWMAWGVHPQAMIGHSIGEYVAACLAGVISLEDALALVAVRGRMMHQLPVGIMLAVPLPEQSLAPLLGEHLSLAALNGPSRCVVSGPGSAIEALEYQLKQKDIVCQRLHTSHAFHSRMMDSIVDTFTEQVQKLDLRYPKIPYISNLTGTWITAEEAVAPRYWAAHMRQTVRFSEGIRLLLQEPERILLEVGPGQALSSLVKLHSDNIAERLVLASLRPMRHQVSDVAFLLKTLGQLWLEGIPIDWAKFSAGERRRRVSLPTYPFERKRYWLEASINRKHEHMHANDIQKRQYPAQAPAGRVSPISMAIEEKGTLMSEQQVPVQSNRHGRIVTALRKLFASLFRVEEHTLEHGATFLEMGADSLFLLQASQAIRDKFGVKVPFRLLLEECPTLETLALYMEKEPGLEEQENTRLEIISNELPAPPQQPPSFPPVSTASLMNGQRSAVPVPPPDKFQHARPNTEVTKPASMTGLEQIMAQQLQIISQQLDLLRSAVGEKAALPEAHTAAAPLAPEAHSVLGPADISQLRNERVTGSKPLEPDVQVPSLQIDPETFVPFQPKQKSAIGGLSPQQQQHMTALIERLTKLTPGSKQSAQTYRPFLADSRATAGFSFPFKELVYPLIVQRASGSTVWDVDGNRYVDLAMGFGSLLFGHSPSFIIEVMEQQLKQGMRLGLQSDHVGKVAALLCELTNTERATFCNSGTEAVMTALRLARAVTGRARIAVFAGSFHGTFDGVLVRAQETRDKKLQAIPIAPGIPPHMIEDVIILHFGKAESLRVLQEHAHELAAVLVELPQSRRPDLLPTAFLRELRQFTLEAGAALIFDEVVSGFRMHPGGAQALFDIRADLIAYGKALGGGLPIGVVAGKAQYMDAIDGGIWNYGDASYPQAIQTFFAGTYFRHPLLMPALWATLNYIKESGPQLQQQLDQRTSQLVKELNVSFEQAQVPVRATHFSSLFRFVFPPELKSIDASVFFYHLLEKGIYIPETRSCFLSTAHTDEDIAEVLWAVRETVAEMKERGFLLPHGPGSPTNGSRPSQRSTGVLYNGESVSSAPLPPSSPLALDRQEVRTVPLTSAQKELWFLAQMGDDASHAYYESMTLHMRGPFNAVAMCSALQELVNRHEALRTTFSLEEAYQRIASTLTIDIPLIDLAALETSKQEAHVVDWIAAEVQKPFDIERGPLVRFRIIKLEEEYHLLIFTMHHIVADGWSVGILLQELCALYSASCQGIVAQLPEPMQYSEYARWQEQQQGFEKAAAKAYWLKQFASPVPLLELPADHERPLMKTYNGARKHMMLDTSLFNSLKDFSVQQGCTIFTTLLTAFNLWLYRLTGQKDMAIAISAAGQLSMSNQRLVGHCVNLLPLRCCVTGNPTLASYLKTVKTDVLNAYNHQAYPFIQLIKNLNLPRDPGRMQLVNVGFNLDYASDLAFSDLSVELVANATRFAKLDIFLNMTHQTGGLQVECDYNTDLFEGETIQRWMEYLKILLKGMVANPGQHLPDLPFLPEAELRQILVDWNNTRVEYSQDTCVHSLFETQVERTPDATAVIYENVQLTYGALNQYANQVAHHIQALGVGPETRVGICIERSPEMIVGLLAVLKAGGGYVPLDPSYPAERLSFMLQDAQVRVLLTQERLLVKLPAYEGQVICLDTVWETVARESFTNPTSTVRADNLAYIIYTSGSTGKPKGVLITHQNLVHSTSARLSYYSEPAHRFLLLSSISFDSSVAGIFWTLCHGGALVLPQENFQHDPLQLLQLIARQYVSHLLSIPSLYDLLLSQAQSEHLTPLDTVIAAGEACPRELAERHSKLLPHVLFFNEYGPTEGTVWSSVYRYRTQGRDVGTQVPIGQPIANMQIYLLNADLQPVPAGVRGELYISGDGLGRGYLNRPELTAERFVPHPFTTIPGVRLYRTGDLARYLPDGNIEFLGRLDTQVKLRGYRIEPGEIEAVMAEHPGVREAVITVREDVPGAKRLVAYAVPRSQQAPSVSELQHYMQMRLPGYMVPSTFVMIETLPLTPNGKVDRQALVTSNGVKPELEQTFPLHLTPTEKLLVEIWRQILGIDTIGIHDNFFELGGDSILGIRIVAKANEKGLRLMPKQLFQHQTIAELAGAAGFVRSVEAEQDVITGPVPLTPIQWWFFEQHLPNPHHWNQALLLEVQQPLELSLLEEVIYALLKHHDALRLRANWLEGIWQLVEAAPDEIVPVSQVDLATLSEIEQRLAIEKVADKLQTSLNLSHGPLLRVAYFNLGEQKPGRLLIIIHHLAMDIVSWQILLEDLQIAYRQIKQGGTIQLAPKTTSFQHWAQQLTAYAQKTELQQELSYWLAEVRKNAGRLPVDYPAGRDSNTEASALTISASLTAEETRVLLQEVPKVYRTQPVEALLTALVLAFAQWSGQGSLLIDLEGHGREDIFEHVDLSRTIGWFTAIYPVLLELKDAVGPGETLKAIKEQLRRVPNGGIGYGVLRYLCEDANIAEQLRLLPQAELSFNYQGRSAQALDEDSLIAQAREPSGMVHSPQGMRSYLLEVNGFISEGQLQLYWTYSRNIHRRSTVEAAVRQYITALRSLIAHCQSPDAGGYTPSDFPEADLSQKELDELVAQLPESME